MFQTKMAGLTTWHNGQLSRDEIEIEGEESGQSEHKSSLSTMIVFFGSPLLDIIAKVDQNFLKKYNLKPDNAIRASPELEGIFIDILNFNPILQPGGSVTNTARVFQWVGKKSYPMTFFGPIGDDNFGKIIEDKFFDEEIHCHLMKVKGQKTGTCAVLLTDENRSLVTHLGASKFFSPHDLDEYMWNDIYKAKYLYLSAFLIGANYDTMKELIHHFLTKKKYIIINLGASFLCEKYPKEVSYLFENADMVFGNESEYKSLFARIFNIENTNASDLLLASNKISQNTTVKTLVMTRGEKSVFVLSDNKLEEFQSNKLHEDEIVDTNGAGDAFVGGFLAQFLKNKSISDCVKCGMWAAKEIIQNHGCNFNNKLVYDFSVSFFVSVYSKNKIIHPYFHNDAPLVCKCKWHVSEKLLNFMPVVSVFLSLDSYLEGKFMTAKM